MWHVFRELGHMIQRMKPEEYLLLVAMAMVLGWFCLRGFGSRSSY
jgi:hypothetical protein